MTKSREPIQADDECAPSPIEQSPGKPRAVALIGLIISAIALIGALTSPWIIEALEPPVSARDVGEKAADIAAGFKDRLKERLTGNKAPAPPPPASSRSSWTASRWVPATVIGLGSIGILLGGIGWMRREDRRYTLAAGLLGIAAIGAMWLYVLVLIAIALLLVWIVLTALGVSTA